jgi:NDP-sugar pyrophosphorylase family protein
MKVLMLLVGDWKTFRDHGYAFPKYLVDVGQHPLIKHVLTPFQVRNYLDFVFCIREDHVRQFHLGDVLRLLVPRAEVVVRGETLGAACTALLAIEHIDNDEPLLVANGDQIVAVAIDDVLDCFTNNDLTGGIVTFESVHPRWSFVRFDDQGLVETAEKRPINRCATAGLYWFRRGSDFVRAVMKMIESGDDVSGRYFVCPAYNQLILEGTKIGPFHIDVSHCHTLSHPRDVQAFAGQFEARP